MAKTSSKSVVFASKTDKSWDRSHGEISNENITFKVDIHVEQTTAHMWECGWAAIAVVLVVFSMLAVCVFHFVLSSSYTQ